MAEPTPAPDRRRFGALALLGGSGALAATPAQADIAAQTRQVREHEEAFARSMAERNFVAFGALIADDANFLNGGQALRGKPAILAYWKRFFESPAAPFSWAPEQVEMLTGGGLGMTVGPVKSPAGATFAMFYSVWREAASGRWLVVFDNGYSLPACPAPKP
jgi:ketosteroid isomerase-like protein